MPTRVYNPAAPAFVRIATCYPRLLANGDIGTGPRTLSDFVDSETESGILSGFVYNGDVPLLPKSPLPVVDINTIRAWLGHVSTVIRRSVGRHSPLLTILLFYYVERDWLAGRARLAHRVRTRITIPAHSS
ncbi:MAG: hypothetical protein ACLPKT_08155 [Methylocella sp.]